MSAKIINLRQRGNSEGFVIEKEDQTGSWQTYFTVFHTEEGYKLVSQNSEYIVYRKKQILNKFEELIAQDTQNSSNKFIKKFEKFDTFMSKSYDSILYRSDNFFSYDSVGLGTKGYAYLIKKDYTPLSVAIVKPFKKNNNFKLTLCCTEEISEDDIESSLLIFMLSYISSSEIYDAGSFKLEWSATYSINMRKYLPKEFRQMLTNDMLPSKIESMIWYINGLIIMSFFLFIKPDVLIFGLTLSLLLIIAGKIRTYYYLKED
ncbi:hypothetical protein BG262_05785 [Floricoccus penangensis]|uniref:Uncharacterized protein n=1 Tax=Floricoccus penangensis TaxID=1859475 RepID=A0A9Q5JER8_9LACT|nr:hypothetical protein [Floricoccus penangensis]OFI45994.1 hypothetical protein BG262_05785 [Floricoccus penangensis]